ncbi:MAG: VCBS repeat-containing protein [Planctomycetota bacterium]|nr:MAG: VCBS repeat-containing protein [Planctomycetota bacterium]
MRVVETILLVLLVLAALVGWLLFGIAPPPAVPPPVPVRQSGGGAPQRGPAPLVPPPHIASFCGGCHAFPSPTSFPKDAWAREVRRGFQFYRQSSRTDLVEPIEADVVAWFRQAAPDRLPLPSIEQSPSPLRFESQTVPFVTPQPFAAVSALDVIPGSVTGLNPAVIFGDMYSGNIAVLQPGPAPGDRATHGGTPVGLTVTVLARSSHPAGIHLADLDRDGVADWVIADLGSFEPADHELGRVLWLHGELPPGAASPDRPGGDADAAKSAPPRTLRLPVMERLELSELATGLGRVADVRPIDVDADGDMDLAVAEFGWLESGRLLWLEHRDDAQPPSPLATFQLHELDPRHGTIHVPITDLDRDGHEDIIALFSQEHESVEVFLNRGRGTFEKRLLYAAGDPAYGSSGIELTDLDGDGDTDVLYCNGDTLDSFYIKPYHGLKWLENDGAGGFRPRQLTHMPGIHQARTADLDGDGDRDIVACAYLPERLLRSVPEQRLDTLIWLEQAAPGRFVRHPLEASSVGHVALAIADLDRDGRPDIVTGNFTNQTEGTRHSAWLSVWWNRGRRSVLSVPRP